jgi:hypothetical protein
MRMLAFENPQALGNELPHGLLLLSNEDLTQYLQFMAGAITAARKPFPQAQAEFQALEQRLPTASGSRLNKLRCVRTLLLIPTLDAALAATARGNAQSEAAATAIAIEQYRRQQGTLPERLEQLVPEFLPQLPADPFNGQPLRYVMQPDHYLLYSVGQDGVDNGGQTESQRDVVFRVRKTAPDR